MFSSQYTLPTTYRIVYGNWVDFVLNPFQGLYVCLSEHWFLLKAKAFGCSVSKQEKLKDCDSVWKAFILCTEKLSDLTTVQNCNS